ncbi:conserved hypothetical protein [Verticillium alfalfae VaMs.102]|uniref:Uncharacterized protein n=1 Tax=Verticillium alfalfae (strain VaMs.102 / ATCC MYA-4576 / FGSC 10136) TaxID=526221 RepID=C9SBQ8_VERA1|nr:conserved hypothetical protein [Verticillium alfalfae VaMs.102]EEY15792.1 conserved hypothetical protein [Verticillium alfalfae VaMs.102]
MSVLIGQADMVLHLPSCPCKKGREVDTRQVRHWEKRTCHAELGSWVFGIRELELELVEAGELHRQRQSGSPFVTVKQADDFALPINNDWQGHVAVQEGPSLRDTCSVWTNIHTSAASQPAPVALETDYTIENPSSWCPSGPGGIFLTRTVVTLYFNFRIERLSVRLKEQQDERAKTIQKLKDATKYDSTMQLLEKYGGENKTDKDGKKADSNQQNPGSKQQNEQQQQGQHGNRSGRTALPPPPTANIQRRNGPVGVATPGTHQSGHGDSQLGASRRLPASSRRPSLRPTPTPSSRRSTMPSRPSSRPTRRTGMTAPPGTKSLAELGMWKCMSCGAANGEVDEGKRIVDEVLRSKETTSEVTAGEEFKEEEDSEEETPEMVQVGKDEVGPEGQASGKHTASGTRKRKGKKG